MWGQGTCDPAHTLLEPEARAEEGMCQGRMGKGRSVEGNSRGRPCLQHSKTSRGRATSR